MYLTPTGPMIDLATLLSFALSKFRLLHFSLLFFLVICSCGSKSDKNSPGEVQDTQIDSIDVILEKSRDNSFSEKDRKFYLSEALKISKNIKTDTSKLTKLLDIRASYLEIKDLESYKNVNAEIRVLAKKLNDSLQIANTYLGMGFYYLKKEKIDSAYSNYYLAQQLYAKLNSPEKTGRALLTMAIIQKNERDYIGGEASSVKAIEYLKLADDLRYLTSAYTNLGLISIELGRYEKALEYHELALEGRKKMKDKALQAGSLNNIGFAYFKKEQYDKAINYYEQGLGYDSIYFTRTQTYARLLDNLAFAKFKSGETRDLPQQLIKPLLIKDSIGDNLGAVTSHNHLAEYYKSVDSVNQFREQALIAMHKAKPIKFHQGMLKALTLLSESDNETEALASTRAYIQLSDSLQQAERRFQEQFARIRFETDKIETENTEVNRRNRQLFIGLLSVLALFLLVYIIIQKKLNQKELLFRESQQTANEEIYNLMLAQQLKLEEGKHMEKKRFSEELHDGVLGRLFGARLSLDSLNTKHDEDSVQTRLKYIEELKSIETEIRQISHGLNATIFSQDILFTEVIEQLIEIQNTLDTNNPSKYKFINDYIIHWESMPNNIKVHLYRIVQESLQNIHKHAMAKNGIVSFIKEKDDILLRIEDDGLGMVINKVKKGIGLKNIKSRVEQMKGILKVDSEKGKGTTITVKISS